MFQRVTAGERLLHGITKKFAGAGTTLEGSTRENLYRSASGVPALEGAMQARLLRRRPGTSRIIRVNAIYVLRRDEQMFHKHGRRRWSTIHN